jgi:PEP-CTERM motif
MKTTIKLMGILAIFSLLTLVAGIVSAQSLKVQIDENGVGFSNGIALPYSISQDPISGLSTLMYQLPYPLVTPGDVILTESTGAISDLIRFDNNPAGGVVFFFSDPADESPAPLADNPFGIPPFNAAIPPVFVTELGSEGADGAAYLASNGSPGCAVQAGVPLTVFYNIISDSVVPEPSTLVLLSMSVIGLLCYAWLKRKEMVMFFLMQLMKLTGFFFRALASIGLLAFATSSAQGAMLNLSTGLDASNSLITIGNTPDAHWTVDQIGGGTAPARVVTASDADGVFIGSIWAADGPSSNWIAIDATTIQNDPFAPLPYSYYRTFTLTPSDLATATISGVWGIDDGGDLKLNGNTVSSLVNDYTASTPFLVPAGSSFFVPGLNKLTITMNFSDNQYEAVRLQATLTPEPSTLALLGMSVLGLLAYNRRKRK